MPALLADPSDGCILTHGISCDLTWIINYDNGSHMDRNAGYSLLKLSLFSFVFSHITYTDK